MLKTKILTDKLIQFLLFGLLCVSCSAYSFPWGFGEPVYDQSVSQALWSNLPQELEQAISTAKSLQQELQRLDHYNWDSAQEKINALGKLVDKENTIAYSASDIDTKFRATYPGYNPSTNYTDQYKNIVTTTQSTLNSILQSMGSSASNFQNEDSRLRLLQKQAENADGQTKAIQASAQIASAEVEQLQLLRQTVIAQTNAQTAYYAAEIQKDASSKAAFDSYLNTSKQDVNGKLDQYPINDPFEKQ